MGTVNILMETFNTMATNIWNSSLEVLPGVVAGVIIILVGWLIATLIEKVVKELTEKSKIDKLLKNWGVEEALGEVGLSTIFGKSVKWYMFVLFLEESANVMSLTALSSFLNLLVLYVPKIIGASLVIIGALLAGEFLRKRIEEIKLAYKNVFAGAVKFITLYFGVVIGLQTIGLNASILIEAFRIGLLAVSIAVAIAVGLGLGLAFKKDIKKLVEEFKK